MTNANKKIEDTTATETAKTKGVPKKVIAPTGAQIEAMSSMNVSQKIRYLAKEGYSTADNRYSGIANYLGKRTQHVRNVLNQPLKKTA